jgi:hypothetical protein
MKPMAMMNSTITTAMGSISERVVSRPMVMDGAR